MNEIVTLAVPAVRTLTADVIRLLKTEIGDQGTVAALDNHVLISFNQPDFELRMGNILQQIYRVVEQHFPVRNEHVNIIMRDTNSTYENVFKIWKSA
ncbi:hypothetical protein [Mucilaginibacter antarcticus]|uniref:Uncharacterized protein n=1 Tax=Mucilaginibacter antarcticus TaxID=1855725 RepID=A0ABW5XQC2_9SPHI